MLASTKLIVKMQMLWLMSAQTRQTWSSGKVLLFIYCCIPIVSWHGAAACLTKGQDFVFCGSNSSLLNWIQAYCAVDTYLIMYFLCQKSFTWWNFLEIKQLLGILLTNIFRLLHLHLSQGLTLFIWLWSQKWCDNWQYCKYQISVVE